MNFFGKYFGYHILTTLFMIICFTQPGDTCSCMLEHAQKKYCKSDYVIVARILRKSIRKINYNDVYKIEIKKAYKLSTESNNYLREGRLLTPESPSMCGINLKIGKLYLIAGIGDRVSLCDYVKEYSKMSIVERRGFAGGYRKGCNCDIKPIYRNKSRQQYKAIGTCMWNMFSICESDFSACVPSKALNKDGKPTKCHWRSSTYYNKCVDDNEP